MVSLYAMARCIPLYMSPGSAVLPSRLPAAAVPVSSPPSRAPDPLLLLPQARPYAYASEARAVCARGISSFRPNRRFCAVRPVYWKEIPLYQIDLPSKTLPSHSNSLGMPCQRRPLRERIGIFCQKRTYMPLARKAFLNIIHFSCFSYNHHFFFSEVSCRKSFPCYNEIRFFMSNGLARRRRSGFLAVFGVY